MAQVPFELTLNGEDYTTSGLMWSYFANPEVMAISPDRGSAAVSQLLTITRDATAVSSAWVPNGQATCRFESVVDPDGARQVPYRKDVPATVVDTTELQCASPVVNFVAPVTVEVSLNGRDFTSGGLTFEYVDHWHKPSQSGEPPTPRAGMAFTAIGSDIYVFGGEDGNFDANGLSHEFYVLHTDTMSECAARPPSPPTAAHPTHAIGRLSARERCACRARRGTGREWRTRWPRAQLLPERDRVRPHVASAHAPRGWQPPDGALAAVSERVGRLAGGLRRARQVPPPPRGAHRPMACPRRPARAPRSFMGTSFNTTHEFALGLQQWSPVRAHLPTAAVRGGASEGPASLLQAERRALCAARSACPAGRLPSARSMARSCARWRPTAARATASSVN